MSHRTKKNRQLLLSRIAFLALAYALPLGGLALFFAMTGLRNRIAEAGRERLGVQYLGQLAAVHDRVIREHWGWAEAAAPGLDAELARLGALERRLAPDLFPADRAEAPARDLSAPQLRATWDEIRAAPAEGPERNDDLMLLIGKVQALLAHTADVAGLTLSPDLETEAMTDLVASDLPVHLEHLLQMHGHLAAAAHGGSLVELARLFQGQLGREAARLDRGVALAVEADARSAHVAPAFHRDYPPMAATCQRSR